MIVCVARSSISASAELMCARYRRRSRSADSWIGVSGLLISCARRRATSPQAASRGAGAVQHAPARVPPQDDLLAPVRVPCLESSAQIRRELLDHLLPGGAGGC